MEEGFIAGVREDRDGPTALLRLQLNKIDGKVPVVSGLKRISKPVCACTRRRPSTSRGCLAAWVS